MIKAYRTLFSGHLVQNSDLNVGGTDVDHFTDKPLCRNGQGDFILRGSTLAGALLRTARTLFDETALASMTGLAGAEKARQRGESLWQFYNSKHPADDVRGVVYRQGVAIRHDTGAAADCALYDVEAIAHGTEWFFLLEVNTFEKNGALAEYVAAQALLEWTRNRCWLGSDVARGMGWMTLQDVRVWRLDVSYYRLWPDSSKDFPKTPQDLAARLHGIDGSPLTGLLAEISLSAEPRKKPWHYAEIDLELTVGEAEHDAYGLDALSVGSHDADLVEWNGAHFITPRGIDAERAQAVENFDPDHTLAMREGKPFIPGSSLRGVLRHEWARRCRADDPTLALIDPVDADPPGEDIAGQLFGTLKRSAKLLVSDAYLVDDDWQAVLLQRHAEDEFTASTFESAKFNRILLLRGRFAAKLILEGENLGDLNKDLQKLKSVFARAECRHLPLGANQWQGAGWIGWKVDVKPVVKAGETCRTPEETN